MKRLFSGLSRDAFFILDVLSNYVLLRRPDIGEYMRSCGITADQKKPDRRLKVFKSNHEIEIVSGIFMAAPFLLVLLWLVGHEARGMAFFWTLLASALLMGVMIGQLLLLGLFTEHLNRVDPLIALCALSNLLVLFLMIETTLNWLIGFPTALVGTITSIWNIITHPEVIRVDWSRHIKAELTPVIRILSGILCLLVLILGMRWQAKVLAGDELTNFRRIKWAIGVASGALIGATFWSIFSLIDPRANVPIADSAIFILATMTVGLVFVIKTWLGPILLTASLSWAIYIFVAHGHVSLLPVFELVTKHLLASAPTSGPPLYVFLTLVFALVGSVYAVNATGHSH